MTSQPLFLTSLTRIVPLSSSVPRIAPLPREAWATGDYVAVEVEDSSPDQKIELRQGRQIEVAQGDLVVGALGRRYATLEATGSWEEVGEDGRMSLLTGAGLLGRCTSVSRLGPRPTSVTYRGHLHREGDRLRMEDFVAPVEERPFVTPVVLVTGTSMSAGKTTTARIVIRRLRATGRRIVAAKLTGAGRYRDILSMRDAGAEAILDFVDGGLPSTVCSGHRYRRVLRGLLARLAKLEADVAVVEVGASPLEPYNGTAAVEALEGTTRFNLLCSSDPYAVVGLVTAYGRPPDLIGGPCANTLAGVELTRRLTGIRALDLLSRDNLPELDRRLETVLD